MVRNLVQVKSCLLLPFQGFSQLDTKQLMWSWTWAGPGMSDCVQGAQMDTGPAAYGC